MDNQLYKIKTIVFNLEKKVDSNTKVKLLQELVEVAEKYKNQLLNMETNVTEDQFSIYDANIKFEKISEETFLYKPVMVKNFYDGDYLERFSAIRTSDLKTSGVLETHIKFWEAHEVFGGNIFATIPLELVNHQQRIKLEHLNWISVKVDVYEILNKAHLSTTKGKIVSTVEKIFNNFLIVRELYGDILMILHYKI